MYGLLSTTKNALLSASFFASALTFAPFSYAQSTDYNPDQLEEMLYGLSFLGSGGGGGFGDGMTLLQTIATTHPNGITIENFSQIVTDDQYIVAGGIGAPDALSSKIPELIVAINAAIDLASPTQPSSIFSVESGPVNSFLAVAINLANGTPIFDGDGAGRSVPSLTNLSYANQADYPIAPVALAAAPATPSDPPPATKVFTTTQNAAQAEEQIRELISMDPRFGQIAGLALWKQKGDDFEHAPFIPGTFDLAFRVGEVLKANDTDFFTMIHTLEPLLDFEGRSVIASGLGVLDDVSTETVGGFDIGTVSVLIQDDAEQVPVKIYNKNENIFSVIAFPSASPIGTEEVNAIFVTAPSLISYVLKDPNTGKFVPLNNGDDLTKHIGAEIGLIWSLPDNRLFDEQNGWLESFRTQIESIGFPFPAPICPNLNNLSDPWSGCVLSNDADPSLALFVQSEFQSQFPSIPTTYPSGWSPNGNADWPSIGLDVVQ